MTQNIRQRLMVLQIEILLYKREVRSMIDLVIKQTDKMQQSKILCHCVRLQNSIQTAKIEVNEN